MFTDVGETLRFDYTGDVQTIDLIPGKYKLECYGARGGNGHGNSTGGYGGYVSGILKINIDKTLYLYVGQAGNDGNNRRASYNGGAIGGYDTLGGTENGGSGGGATDIRTDTTLESRIIVAGGGGGAGGWKNCYGIDGGIGIQNNILGIGSDGINAQSGGGGGGGGYYGGATNGCTQMDYYVGNGAYGGSNYINPLIFTDRIDKHGLGYGNGYILITFLQRDLSVRYNSNIYNDSNPEVAFDFDLLFNDMEV